MTPSTPKWRHYFRASNRRFAIEYAALRFVGLVFGTLPVEMASAFSGWLWRHIAPWNRRHARALGHLRMAMPEKTEAERGAIAATMWENLGRIFAESFHLVAIAESDRIVIEPLETMDRLARSGTAMVICAPHMGNFELTAVGLVRPGLKPLVVYQTIKNPFVDAYVRRLRAPFSTGGLLPKGSATARSLMKSARNGGTVALFADLRDHKGLKVPFFGTLAPSTIFPALLARTFDAPLYAAHLLREPGVRFRFFIEEIPVGRTADRDADIAVATAALQAVFERSIRRAPEQWMWAHRRWG